MDGFPAETADQIGTVPGSPDDRSLPVDLGAAVAERADDAESGEIVFELRDMGASYSGVPAVRGVTLDVYRNQITAVIGPSGCGKSTLVRCFNRMNDLIPGATVQGEIRYEGQDLYGPDVDPVEVRKRIGMVFQKPNPFPKSIYDNVAFGPRTLGRKKGLDDCVEESLRRAALWDEVKDRLRSDAYSLSGGQQQRLCIARALANYPDVLLMDEPCSALDPISTIHIEDLMHDLRRQLSIVIITHNMQQAARVSQWTAFLTVEISGDDRRTGHLVEYNHTEKVFTAPSDARTEAYVTGRFG